MRLGNWPLASVFAGVFTRSCTAVADIIICASRWCGWILQLVVQWVCWPQDGCFADMLPTAVLHTGAFDCAMQRLRELNTLCLRAQSMYRWTSQRKDTGMGQGPTWKSGLASCIPKPAS